MCRIPIKCNSKSASENVEVYKTEIKIGKAKIFIRNQHPIMPAKTCDRLLLQNGQNRWPKESKLRPQQRLDLKSNILTSSAATWIYVEQWKYKYFQPLPTPTPKLEKNQNKGLQFKWNWKVMLNQKRKGRSGFEHLMKTSRNVGWNIAHKIILFK